MLATVMKSPIVIRQLLFTQMVVQVLCAEEYIMVHPIIKQLYLIVHLLERYMVEAPVEGSSEMCTEMWKSATAIHQEM